MNNQQLKNEAVYDQDRFDRGLWEQARSTGMSRRQLLQVLAATGAAVGFMPAVVERALADFPQINKPTPETLFIRQGATNAEMRFSTLAFNDFLVSKEQFFVRTHVAAPTINKDTWTLTIDGDGVEGLTLDYDDLHCYRHRSVVKFIECAGNGRSFFGAQQGQAATGSQWRLGAVGVAKWTGVRLADVLEDAGLDCDAVDVMAEGLDAVFPAAGTPVRRPIPIEKALDDCLLVTKMNGEDLPVDHGAPVRLLVPGWIGVANIKWLGRLTVSKTPQTSYFNTTAYTINGVALTNQSVKAAFHFPDFVVPTPAPGTKTPVPLPAGRQFLTGRAWSGNGKIKHVEISINGGHWKKADLVGDNPREAWTRWKYRWDAAPGNHVLRARATDSAGNVQPDTVPFNPNGYMFDGVVSVPVVVT